MFGNFRMDYNGAPFVAEKMHKESQFNRMMQALIHYSDCGIAKDKLEEIVIGERDIDAPHTALRVIVYKTKQKLAQLGLEKLLKKATQNNIRLVFYGGENSSIRNAMRLLNRKFDSCEWHEHLKENEIICDDNTVYIVSADADDSNGLEILANAGLENGENYFITQRFLHYTEGGFAL